ncbi:MAG: helix-turn-helix domain-containing protein [Ruminococcus flavefaciens]|nr:helix-turn-helix domain-containing protein [Ruminococcus flavefaciens]
MAEIFAKRLKLALEQAGMKQSELAEKIGAPRSAVSQYLSGKNEPGAERMAAIAAATGVSAGFLMGEELPDAVSPRGWPDKITVEMAARCLRKSNQAVRVNIQNGRLPIGRALQSAGTRFTYIITPERLREEAGEARFNEFFGIAAAR